MVDRIFALGVGLALLSAAGWSQTTPLITLGEEHFGIAQTGQRDAYIKTVVERTASGYKVEGETSFLEPSFRDHLELTSDLALVSYWIEDSSGKRSVVPKPNALLLQHLNPLHYEWLLRRLQRQSRSACPDLFVVGGSQSAPVCLLPQKPGANVQVKIGADLVDLQFWGRSLAQVAFPARQLSLKRLALP